MTHGSSLINLAASATRLAADAIAHFEIDPDDFGYTDCAYWLCHDLGYELEQEQYRIESRFGIDGACDGHSEVVAWIEKLQAACDEIVSLSEAYDHEITR